MKKSSGNKQIKETGFDVIILIQFNSCIMQNIKVEQILNVLWFIKYNYSLQRRYISAMVC